MPPSAFSTQARTEGPRLREERGPHHLRPSPSPPVRAGGGSCVASLRARILAASLARGGYGPEGTDWMCRRKTVRDLGRLAYRGHAPTVQALCAIVANEKEHPLVRKETIAALTVTAQEGDHRARIASMAAWNKAFPSASEATRDGWHMRAAAQSALHSLGWKTTS
jgi:hypothetical protein